MSESNSLPAIQPRSWWLRALFMLVMCVAFHVAAWLLLIIAIVQLVLMAASDGPNERLRAFGRGLGRYLAQIASFVSFASDEVPFPFSDWPAPPAA
jgi:hypothetical protein